MPLMYWPALFLDTFLSVLKANMSPYYLQMPERKVRKPPALPLE
jgi:hypothetical protein